MKKIIFYFLIFVFLGSILLLSYFSIIGVETKNFNNQIKNSVNKINKDLNIQLDKVQIYLNLRKFNIEAKTLNPKISFNNNVIKIESIKTLVSLKSFFKNEFALKNLYLSTKSTKIKDVISLITLFKNSPEIYMLQSKIQNGYLVADVKINFNESGKIKSDYEIDGYIKDGEIELLNKLNLNNIDFLFRLKNNKYKITDLKLSVNEIDFISKKIFLQNKNDEIFIEGDFENKIFEFEKKHLTNIINLFAKNPGIEKIKFSSYNNFSFVVDNKFKINDLSLVSNLNLKNLLFKNKKKGKYFFPDIKDEIILQDHNIKIDLKKNIFFVEGSGDILLQENTDKIQYYLNNQNELYQFQTNLELNQNLFNIKFLNYEKDKNSNANIGIEAILDKNSEINFKIIEVKENSNQILFDNIFLDRNFKIKKIDKINLDYIDNENIQNTIKVLRNKNVYNLIGESFNANSLITKLLESDYDKNEIFKNDFKLNLKLDHIYLDNENYMKNLHGNLNMVNNKVQYANINSNFLNNKKFNFFIKSENDKKITTLFSEEAEPLVKRYNFIKGYEDGSIDFYSTKKNGKSTSRLKIFDFKLQELPALTKLLTLASLQGIVDTLTGEGIRFNEMEMNFTNEGNVMNIEELYAIGPAISILMSGYVKKNKLISLRGTLVPATTINKTIGSIPFLGKILVGSKVGEGVFGVSFKIKGPPDNLETTVNPLKTLTPRFITRTLEKIKKTN